MDYDFLDRNYIADTSLEFFLNGLDKIQYYHLFYDNDIQFNDIFDMTDGDLVSIGILSEIDRKKILQEIIRLKNNPEIKLGPIELRMLFEDNIHVLKFLLGSMIKLRKQLVLKKPQNRKTDNIYCASDAIRTFINISKSQLDYIIEDLAKDKICFLKDKGRAKTKNSWISIIALVAELSLSVFL